MTVAVEFKNVNKEFQLKGGAKSRLRILLGKEEAKTVKAISDVSFKINKGERVAILGMHSSGSSTILRMISGTARPTTGKVIVKGKPSPMLEYTAGFDSEFTGKENIWLRLRILGYSDKDIKKIENDIIEFAELGEFINQPLRTYTNPMKIRLGFAINTAIPPDIILADGGLAAGEGKFKEKSLERVNQILEDKDKTLILATQATLRARRFCTRGIVIDKGIVYFDGEIHEAVDYFREHFAPHKKKKKTRSKGRKVIKEVKEIVEDISEETINEDVAEELQSMEADFLNE